MKKIAAVIASLLLTPTAASAERVWTVVHKDLEPEKGFIDIPILMFLLLSELVIGYLHQHSIPALRIDAEEQFIRQLLTAKKIRLL